MAGKPGERARAATDWVVVGTLRAAHGVRGAARIASYMDQPADIFACTELHIGPAGAPAPQPVRLTHIGTAKGGFLARLSGFDTREALDAARGWELVLPATSLAALEDADSFYLRDLIGLKAVGADGAPLGRVQAVENYGAEDLLEIALETPVKGLGRRALIPFRPALVPGVDLAAGQLTVDLATWLAMQTGEAEPAENGSEKGPT